MKDNRKQFDCVEMKQRIQDQINAEFEGMSEEEVEEATLREIQSHPVFGPMWERLSKREPES